MHNHHLFSCLCAKIPVSDFWHNFSFIFNKVVPPDTVSKYSDNPYGVITASFLEIGSVMNQCFTIEDMHSAFLALSPAEQSTVVSELIFFSLELQALPEESLVFVPEDPVNYLKPFFSGTLTVSNIRC